MGTENNITRFSGTKQEVGHFINNQPTQISKAWIVKTNLNERIYLTNL